MSDPNEPVNPASSGDEPAAPPPPPPSGSPYGSSPDSSAPTPPPADGSAGGGGYGAPPPPPPTSYGDPAYGQPAPTGGYSPTEALSYGWKKFSASPATMLVPMLVVFVGVVVVAVIVEFVMYGALTGTHSCTQDLGSGVKIQGQCGPGLITSLLAAGLASALINLVAQVLTAGLYKGATCVTDGKEFSLGTMFEGWDKTQVVIASAIIAAATFVGTILCYFPALIVGFLTQYTLLFIVDKQMTAVDAIKASISFVTEHLSSTLVYYILAVIVLFVGAILCGVGLLVAAPVALIGLAYTYRRLQDQPVVP